MIELKPIYSNIPSGKYHSVLMTSYSINLYYWNIQLLQTLSKKGINFVSAIVDADCLSEQLLKFSKAFTNRKPLEFSLHGYKLKGAFHPKIQFYVGRDSVMALIGSGNLTICGHGRNMEVWTPVVADSPASPTYPFVREVWQYLKSLYRNLGDEAENIIKSVEENCELLQTDFHQNDAEHLIDEYSSIRLFTNERSNIFSQCVDWIADDQIEEITVMSPFYDSRAELIKTLYEQFHPARMNVIIEDDFGAVPLIKYIPDYVNLFKWDSIRPEGKYQKYYHAKCIFFKGKNYNYVLCGSSNASVAAFGLPGVPSANHEASVGYKSSIVDYLEETGFNLTDPVNRTELKENNSREDKPSDIKPSIWIKEASYDDGRYNIKIDSPVCIKDAKVIFFSGDRLTSSTHIEVIVEGNNNLNGLLNGIINPLYVEVQDSDGNVISNRQFVIPSYSMILNEPSPESLNYRRRCREIEAGQFISGSVLRFIEQVLSDTEGNMKLKSIPSESTKKDKSNEKGYVFDSLEDYLYDDGTGITGDVRSRKNGASAMRSTLLFDSMISYISRSSKEKEDEGFDDEETEDIRKSVGKENRPRTSVIEGLKPKSADDVTKRIIKMFDAYLTYLHSHSGPNNKAITISRMNELKRYMAAMFFIHRLLSFRYTLEAKPGEYYPLLKIAFSQINRTTITEYLFRIVNAFSTFIFQNELNDNDSSLVAEKVNSYRRNAFELTLAVMSVCDWLNEGNNDYSCIAEWHKEQTLKNIGKALGYDYSIVPNVIKQMDRAIQELPFFDATCIQRYADNNMKLLHSENGDCVWTKPFGYVKLSLNENGKTATPCTMFCDWNKTRKWFAPDYAYMLADGRILPIRPQN